MSGDGALFSAREAYDKAARAYDHWPWQDVWRKIEGPRVLAEIFAGPSGRVLDLGTGTGFYATVLATVGVPVIGTDISEEMLGRARRASDHAIPFVLADARALPFASRSFAQILATRVLSQIDDAGKVFDEAARILKPDGAFVISEVDPAHGYSHTTLPSPGGRIAVETFKRSRTELIRQARSHGHFRVASQSWLRTTDLDPKANYNLSSLDLTRDLPLAFVLKLVPG